MLYCYSVYISVGPDAYRSPDVGGPCLQCLPAYAGSFAQTGRAVGYNAVVLYCHAVAAGSVTAECHGNVARPACLSALPTASCIMR